MNISSLKKTVKKKTIDLGIYRPARAISDFLTNRKRRSQIQNDILFYKKMLKSNSLCFDVGANTGEKSYALLKAGMRVIAFEPQPECVKEIKARCKSFSDKLEIIEAGVGSEKGNKILHLNEGDFMSSFHEEWEGKVVDAIEVNMTTLDDCIQQYGVPDYIKIDVEGWEFEVMKGLSVLPPILSFEYHLRDREIDVTYKCLEWMQKLNKEIELNITPGEDLFLEFEQWKTKDEFLSHFPDEFYENNNFYHGDVWVRTKMYENISN